MNHAIKEQINDNTLYVEVEPQPPEWMKDFYWDETFKFKKLYFEGVTNEGFPSKHCVGIPPISIGDTVYQGEEWGAWDRTDCTPKGKPYDPTLILKSEYPDPYEDIVDETPDYAKPVDFEWHPPQTMPISLADKTFKVTGIEVELTHKIIGIDPSTLGFAAGPKYKEKWFWKYSIEEMK